MRNSRGQWDVFHRLTNVCTTMLVSMAFGQVPAGVGVLQISRVRTKSELAASLHRKEAARGRDASWPAG